MENIVYFSKVQFTEIQGYAHKSILYVDVEQGEISYQKYGRESFCKCQYYFV